MFTDERPALQALPLEPFRYYKHGTRSVHLDGCVEVDASYYSMPPGWIGQRVSVQWDSTWVRLLNPRTGELLREHRSKPRGWRSVHQNDRPKRTPQGTLQLLARAERAGPAIGALCKEIHRRREQAGVRRILGVLSLAKKHGAKPIDEACQVAIELGVFEYRFVRRWIERHPPTPLTLRQVDPLIRDLTEYRDLINHITDTEDR